MAADESVRQRVLQLLRVLQCCAVVLVLGSALTDVPLCLFSPLQPSAQLLAGLALLAWHLLAAAVLQLLALVVVRGHLQQPAAVDLNHLGGTGTHALHTHTLAHHKPQAGSGV